jgi:ABC-type nitrate/sulfonate/bicarbonate transport system permease component
MAVVFGMVGGVGLSLATAWLVIRGGENVGKHLGLLRYYFPGYSVTWSGTVLGLFYGALVGALVGWLVAWIYNRVAARRNG